MSTSPEVVIVGAGLAGACAALELSRSREVLVIDAVGAAAGASGAAAGLVNPFMGRKARPVWQLADALAAVRAAVARAEAEDLFDDRGVLRPVVEDGQAAVFRERAAEFPEHLMFLSPEAVAGQYPSVAAPAGALWVRTGGAVMVPSFVQRVLDAAARQGATVISGQHVSAWRSTDTHASVTLDHGEQLQAGHVVLALGYGGVGHPALDALDLRGVKGQTLRVRLPAGPTTDQLPPVAGSGYAVPVSTDDARRTLILGSSYEHQFTTLDPTGDATQQILRKTQRLVPALAEATIRDAVTGVRVYAGQHNRPVLAPLPDAPRVWAFTGLGSKGLLMAPLLARLLGDHLHDPAGVPEALGVPAGT
ncbi:MAG: FAD-dependent oxidoreductase [Bacteroidetes bacterium]|jgi:glycine/D-amino acid oxidase-like deaminating enzyme|nr:FAD-dependent oxidoreductase [Bacteroidota bacterium]